MKQSKFSKSQIMAILKEGDAGVAMYADLALKNAAIKDVPKNNREGLAVEIGASIQSSRVVRVLNRLIDLYSKPAVLHGQRLAGMNYQMDSAFVGAGYWSRRRHG